MLDTSPSLEAQVADLADEITYYSHDLDDALDFAILDSDQLDESAIWRRSHERVAARNPDLLGAELHKNIIRDIIDLQVRDVVATSAPRSRRPRRRARRRCDEQEEPLIRYSEELLAANRELRRFLYENVYYHPRVAEVNRRACEMLRAVFASLCDSSRSDWATPRPGGSRAKGCTGRCAITSPG